MSCAFLRSSPASEDNLTLAPGFTTLNDLEISKK